MVETAVVLGIVGMVVAGIWVAVGILLQEKNTNDVRSQIIRLSEPARSYFRDNPIFDGTRVTFVLVDMGAVPKEMTLQGGYLRTTTRHFVEVLGAGDGSGHVDIIITGIPRSMCISLLRPLVMQTSGTVVAFRVNRETKFPVPYTGGDVAALCKYDGSTTNVEVNGGPGAGNFVELFFTPK